MSLPGMSWTYEASEPFDTIFFIVLMVIVLAIFIFPFWYVISLHASTERIERTLKKLVNQANSTKDQEDRSCPPN